MLYQYNVEIVEVMSLANFKGLQGMRAIVVCHKRKYIMSQEFFLFRALCKDLGIEIGGQRSSDIMTFVFDGFCVYNTRRAYNIISHVVYFYIIYE